MYDLVLLLEVITFEVISLLIRLFLEVLLFAMGVIFALKLAIMVSVFVTIAFPTLMVVAVLAMMMPVV